MAKKILTPSEIITKFGDDGFASKFNDKSLNNEEVCKQLETSWANLYLLVKRFARDGKSNKLTVERVGSKGTWTAKASAAKSAKASSKKVEAAEVSKVSTATESANATGNGLQLSETINVIFELFPRANSNQRQGDPIHFAFRVHHELEGTGQNPYLEIDNKFKELAHSFASGSQPGLYRGPEKILYSAIRDGDTLQIKNTASGADQE